MGSKGHFERIGSNLVTLVYLLQTVDTPFPQQLDIPQEPIVHRLLLQPVVCSCQKERCEKQARGIARGKRKRRGTQMWTGERSPFSPSPWRISFSYARFSGSACPDYSGTSPLGPLYSRDTSIPDPKRVSSSPNGLKNFHGFIYFHRRPHEMQNMCRCKRMFGKTIPILCTWCN